MINLIRSVLGLMRQDKKGNVTGWIIGAVIVAIAIVAAVIIYTQNQTHPFWEVK